MFESTQRKRDKQTQTKSEADSYWLPVQQQQNVSGTPMQRQAALHYDVDAMLDTVSSEQDTAVQRQSNEQANENHTGMPDRLKSGLEQLSGFDLSNVRVHRNSAKPAQLNALAYAQGQTIHLGPGQEKQLPHEGWHIVQQMQGRVRPTMQAHGVDINDDVALEREADRMGTEAARG
ncbi:DUF4157 domain-containing protein [Leptolyngbyaceae cyanobacterium CCMR0082]|uniref:DUF4157 domain-containing protein n=1 Tax=Adonisia turfae CCMR0082 TaxID=2304604 RepID=A0A6M0SH54_9CYAN|nr:DUF4157 domain-containing protein [Adonisia turfae]MDV3348643.1 DUF4157 domain-containing protein [Leptothoe sp. LEGE 181152]NEZ67313.1 DUF4157 domain-containing protein [Adonisia turfae CCMR0082]